MATEKKRSVAKRETPEKSLSPRQRRVEKIRALQDLRKSKVITYVTSTRANYEVQMALDVVRYVYEHLRHIERERKNGPQNIDLFIHSNGGDGTVPWRLVTLVREYTKHFSVLVPNRAFSAATLTALGANEVVMHPMGVLGPTDATVSNAFNPADPFNPQRKLGISVEDVTAYFQLVRDDAGIQHEDEFVQAFNQLATQVHPLALGNVKRSISQSRLMARKLLSLHMGADKAHDIDQIVENLTSKSFYHGHPINRVEARDQVGLPTVKDASKEVEAAMWSLFEEYEDELRLNQPFDPALEFGKAVDTSAMNVGVTQRSPDSSNNLVFVESEYESYVNADKYYLNGTMQPNGALNVGLFYTYRGWSKED